ncbi:hypothetical protein MNBD_ALPHA02-927 [hydrothermal vent metagenome]|uniref:Ice-binding protein C-terminal domain-containing protein n=1 Tax=hydrothermal vent metagenome TaxID=652676 RepID=A0A3B0RBQ7_9ZZZZ
MTKFLKYACGTLIGISCMLTIQNVNATTLAFNNGDSLTNWTTDRFAPNGFNIVNNELNLVLDSGDYQTSGFNNTQGKSLNTSGSNYLSVDMYIDSGWASLNQRIGGMWGEDVTNLGARTDYWPIIEYHGALGWGIWTTANAWIYNNAWNVNLDEFNTIAFSLINEEVKFYINSVLVYSAAGYTGATNFGSVILQGINKNAMANDTGGVNRTIRFDNLAFNSVPEPAPLALLGLGLIGLGIARRRARK